MAHLNVLLLFSFVLLCFANSQLLDYFDELNIDENQIRPTLGSGRYKRGIFKAPALCCGEPLQKVAWPEKCQLTPLEDSGLIRTSFQDYLKKAVCAFDCIGKEMNLMDADNKIDQAKYVETFKKIDSDPTRTELLDKYIGQCVERSEHATRMLAGRAECNPQMFAVARCMTHNIMMNCPPEKVSKSENCTTALDRIKQYADKFSS